MQEVTIRKEQLRELVTANRDKHRGVFEAALAGYEKEAVRQLQAHIERIRNGRVANVQVFMSAPEDHTRDYDRVLRMLELEVGDTVTLDEKHFRQYVEDDWTWRREFLGTASTYAAAAVEVAYGEVVEE